MICAFDGVWKIAFWLIDWSAVSLGLRCFRWLFALYVYSRVCGIWVTYDIVGWGFVVIIGCWDGFAFVSFWAILMGLVMWIHCGFDCLVGGSPDDAYFYGSFGGGLLGFWLLIWLRFCFCRLSCGVLIGVLCPWFGLVVLTWIICCCLLLIVEVLLPWRCCC